MGYTFGMAKYRALRNVTQAPDFYEAGEVYDEKDLGKGLDLKGDFELVDGNVDTDEEVEAGDGDDQKDLSSMTRAELEEYAVEHTNLDPSEYRKKGDLLEAIEEELG